MNDELTFENVRREAQMRMAHAYGYCITNNCNLGYDKLSISKEGTVIVTSGEGNVDQTNINC